MPKARPMRITIGNIEKMRKKPDRYHLLIYAYTDRKAIFSGCFEDRRIKSDAL